MEPTSGGGRPPYSEARVFPPPDPLPFPARLRGFAPKNPAFQKMVFVGVDGYWLVEVRHRYATFCNQSPSLVLVVKQQILNQVQDDMLVPMVLFSAGIFLFITDYYFFCQVFFSFAASFFWDGLEAFFLQILNQVQDDGWHLLCPGAPSTSSGTVLRLVRLRSPT